MRWWIVTGTAAGYVFALTAGCHLAAGLDGVEFTESGGAPGTGAAGPGGTGGSSGPGGNEGGAAGGGATGGAGGSIPTEDCTNGIDDDGDDLIDCEDDACTPAYLCVPNAPTDWLGPVVSFSGATAPTACPTDYDSIVYEGVSGLDFDPVTCTACACTAPNTACNPAALERHSVSNCSDLATAIDQSTCHDFGSPHPVMYLSAGPPTAAPGSGGCAQSGGAIDVSPTPGFDNQARLCEVTSATGAGCLSDQACMPAVGSSSFEQTHCIYRAGDHACPPPYNDQRQIFDGTPSLVDTRDCGACSCPFTGSCTGSTALHSSSTCTSVLPTTIPNNGSTCTSLGSDRAVRFVGSNITGSCPATGGGATGDVTVDVTAPITTVCCLP